MTYTQQKLLYKAVQNHEIGFNAVPVLFPIACSGANLLLVLSFSRIEICYLNKWCFILAHSGTC